VRSTHGLDVAGSVSFRQACVMHGYEGVLREGRPALLRQAIHSAAEVHRLNDHQHRIWGVS